MTTKVQINDEESIEIWHECEKAMQKADNLTIGDLYAVSNYIQEKYPDAV